MKTFDSFEYDAICRYERKRITQLPYNDQYTQQFTYCGKIYCYDPDYDCFYPITPWEELSHWDKYGWIYTSIVLTVAVLIVEYTK